MSKDDIDKAVKEAAQFEEQDKKRKEEIDVRNEADQMVYQCDKILSENGDKINESDKKDVEDKLNALKEALKGDNADDIKAKKEELTQSFYKISEEIYKQAAAAQQAAGGAQQNPGAGAQGNAPGQDGYYETNYTDVEDEPNKK